MKPEKLPRNAGMTVRLTSRDLRLLEEEAKEAHITLSRMLTKKVRSAVNMLFNAISVEEKKIDAKPGT